jgi:tetratricopeptide (TPR) repeat protein
MNLSPGSRLGPYEVVAPLGAGEMGEVYRARDTRRGRTVAINVLRAGLADDPDQRRRFELEARAVSVLNHEHICTLYDIGSAPVVRAEQAGSPPEIGGVSLDYLVMEYVEGQTLADRLKAGPLPLDQVVRLGVELADALDTRLNPDDARALYMGANGLVALGETETGLAWARRAADMGADDAMTLDNVGCVFRLAGHADEALDCLEQAFDAGLTQRAWFERDSNLDFVRNTPRFQALLGRLP